MKFILFLLCIALVLLIYLFIQVEWLIKEFKQLEEEEKYKKYYK